MFDQSNHPRTPMQNIPISELLLDPENPRLPEYLLGESQREILKWMYQNEVLEELGRSFLENGFFTHEPLLVLYDDELEKYLVLEGNRRLAALTILLQLPTAIEADLKFSLLPTPTKERFHELSSIPTSIINERQDVRKFLGFRHIGGLKTWSPEAKARYIEVEVELAPDQIGIAPFQFVARLVGSTIPAIRGQYIALRLLRIAAESGIDTEYVLRYRFGVWNRLLNSPDVRQFMGLGNLNSLEDVKAAEASVDTQALEEIIDHLTPMRGTSLAVLRDSRDATVYGQVLASSAALSSLRKSRDLSLARQIIERGNLPHRISQLINSVNQLVTDIDSFDVDSAAVDQAGVLVSSTRSLQASLKAALEDSDD